MEDLLRFIEQLPKDKEVPASEELRALLEAHWHKLRGGNATAMRATKANRFETARWTPPVLILTIERHGGTARGSVYAERQQWHLDTSNWSVEPLTAGRRLVGKRDAPFRPAPVAAEIAAAIREHRPDPRLDWKSKKRVLVRVTDALPPATNKQTRTSRRKRFRQELDRELEGTRWNSTGPMSWTYTLTDATT